MAHTNTMSDTNTSSPSTTTSHPQYRKPYTRPVRSKWWRTNGTYMMYMVREFTVIPVLLASLEVLSFMVIAVALPNDADAIIGSILSHPLAILLNILTLVAVLFHTVTWFSIMPKAVRLPPTPGPAETRIIGPTFWVLLLSGTAAVAAVLITLGILMA